ncbi:MAG: nucleotidyltransferase family protein [Oscillospiraceae bacterium]|nr:nucleotidyltransferase family protein [Oscillospiraceae bacterium]
MKTVGIICEYNPLHLGHEHQMKTIRAQLGEDTAILCVMSGNFVQRGEPAVLDKYTRAKGAILAGADLVLELPTEKVLSSAEGFAAGAVEILHKFGNVDYLAFGSESGNLSQLLLGADAVLSAEFSPLLKEKLSQGLSYAVARQKTLETLTGIENFCRTPNDILALEYCLQLKKQGTSIKPMAILREGDYHEKTLHPHHPSATALRENMQNDTWLSYVPTNARKLFASAPQYCYEAGQKAMLARLRVMEENEWTTVAHGSEGLWRKVMKNVREKATVEEIIDASLSKRYPRTRLKRLLLCAYLGIGQADLSRPTDEVRILAFSEKGKALLRGGKDRGEIHLLNAGEKPQREELFTLWRRYSDLFSLFAVDETGLKPAKEQSARYYI